MKLVNLTPHTITIRTADSTITVPPSGTVARCAVASAVAQYINVDGVEVAVNATHFGDIVNLPDPADDTIYITSTLIAQRAQRADVLAPDTGASAIRNDAGQIVAVTAMQKF